MSHMADEQTATLRARQLTALTEQLTQRLQTETRAFEERRPQDVVASLPQTQEMANVYRRESLQIRVNPGLISPAAVDVRMALVKATETFDEALAQHALAVEAARSISEGLVQSIAKEVASSRAVGTGYGASGAASVGDARAVTFDRSA